jgi:hypothetical protein
MLMTNRWPSSASEATISQSRPPGKLTCASTTLSAALLFFTTTCSAGLRAGAGTVRGKNFLSRAVRASVSLRKVGPTCGE